MPDHLPHVEKGSNQRRLRRLALGGADLISCELALVIAILAFAQSALPIALLGLPVLLVVGAELTGYYRRDRGALRHVVLEEVVTLFHVSTLFTLGMWLMAQASSAPELRPIEVLLVWCLLFSCLLLGRMTARFLMGRFFRSERCLVIGTEAQAAGLARKFNLSFLVKAHVVGVIPVETSARHTFSSQSAYSQSMDALAVPVLGHYEALEGIVGKHAVDRVVILSSPDQEKPGDVVRQARRLGIPVSLQVGVFNVVGSEFVVDEFDGVRMLTCNDEGHSRLSNACKRCFDFVGAAALLVLTAPFSVLMAAIIKATSSGPVFYPQTRVGRNGVTFQIFKFRTMVEGADDLKAELEHMNETEGLFKIADDPRVTAIGRFLRKSSLDELPQLINVLRGEMSLVGPRPLVVEDDVKVIGWQRDRLLVRPGMTGPWQVIGSTRIPLDEMVNLDYQYVNYWTIWTDLKILIRTGLYVAGGRSS